MISFGRVGQLCVILFSIHKRSLYVNTALRLVLCLLSRM